MNAKKIMGAVLVALLAAALFIGAGAAADGTDYGTVFIYQNQTTLPAGVWTLVGGTAAVTTVDVGSSKTAVMPGADFVAGTYKKGDDTVYFCKPTASYALTAETDTGVEYIVANGGKVYNNSKLVFEITALNKTSNPSVGYYITYPNGDDVNTTSYPSTFGAGYTNKGVTKIQAVFDASKFVKGTPEELLLDENSFSFTVVGVEDATISASVDTAFSGEVITFVVEGTPGEQYNVTLKGFDIPDGTQVLQKFTNGSATASAPGYINFTVGNSGKFTFKATANSSTLGADDDKNKGVVELQKYSATASEYKTLKNGKITIKISAPVVTATLGATSYFIGDNIEISGTSTAKTEYTFNISGINFKSTGLTIDESESEFGNEWNAVLLTNDVKELGNGKKLDVGTYTIEIIGKDGKIVKTVSVVLKQPFISILEAPEVIVQGTVAEFLINAEATNKIAAYIFGTNYFKNFSMTQGIDVEDEDVPNQFTITLNKEITNKTKMAAGQYFMVIQHPMYDGELNVTVDAAGIFWVTTGSGSTSKLFDVNDRQTANAAQALCDALDSQNFDDMYVKYSFFIVGEDESFSISEIPTTVAQGETITISGVDTANAGETIQVTMLSTAFAAVPKEDSNSAAFILVTTEIAEDGTWEVTLDTSALAIDEYNLAVKIQGEEADKKNVRVNVVEAADKPDTPDTPDVPDTPDTPDTPTEPETPGFGALAALAGLGAVAVLLLRRE